MIFLNVQQRLTTMNYTQILLFPQTINYNKGHCQGENIYILKLF